MNHSPDPQLCTMSDAEEGFRNTLQKVFDGVEWDISELSPGHLYATTEHSENATVECADRKQGGRTVSTYTVNFGDVAASSSNLRDAADEARHAVSEALRALESVGMEVEP